MHDVGKTGVDIEIVHPTDAESSQIDRTQASGDKRRAAINIHPETGFLITQNLFRDEPSANHRRLVPQLVLTHHCHNASGTSYPNAEAMSALAAEGVLDLADLDNPILHRLSSLLAVSDVYEAITAARTYTKGRGFEDPARVRQILEESHPTMSGNIAQLMSIHFRRFPPDGWMPTIDWSERGQ